MGLLSRTKGKVFERRICAILRERWPDIVVHRSSQADRAYQADIVVESGGPAVLRKLWLECHDSKAPNPRAKLEQAERDLCALIPEWHWLYDSPTAVVVWHRTGERTHWVTMRLHGLVLMPGASDAVVTDDLPQLVTLELGEFLDMLEGV